MSGLKQYEGAISDVGTFMDIGFITTITKDPAEKGTMGNGVFYSIKFIGKNNRGVAKAFGNTAKLVQDLVANAEVNDNGRPVTQQVMVKASAKDSAVKNEDGTWTNFPISIVIEDIFEAPGLTKELWSYRQED